MDVRFVDAHGLHDKGPDDLDELLGREDGFVWVDVPVWDEETDERLAGLGFHPMLREACRRRNYVPVVHGYEDHVLVTTQSPLSGTAGHVHLLELDQVIGRRFLVTVHGPLNPDVDVAHALEEVRSAARRIESGRFRPQTPVELSYAVTSAVARRQSALVREVAGKLPGLEREVMTSELRNPEDLLETMFLIRHELVTARTMAAQCHEVWLRMAGIGKLQDDADGLRSRDLADQFDRVRALAEGEAQFLFGVIELYQTKVHTKMTVAMERLAVIAAVTLPVTALASVYGMNVIVNESTHWAQLVVILLVMASISLLLLTWARRQGWW